MQPAEIGKVIRQASLLHCGKSDFMMVEFSMGRLHNWLVMLCNIILVIDFLRSNPFTPKRIRSKRLYELSRCDLKRGFTLR